MARAAEAAYSRIRSGILSGELERGERLGEEMLAELAGVSRTPVRDALRRLEAEGLVEFLPTRGVRVTAWSERELQDLYEIRAMLEGHGARLAAERIEPEELETLQRLAEEMTETQDLEELMTLNSQFHWLIVRSSRNSQLDALVRGLVDAPLIQRTFEHYSEERRRAALQHHHEIVAALRSGNGPWADATMRAHVLAARATVAQAVTSRSEQD